jgi:hypothetical protein
MAVTVRRGQIWSNTRHMTTRASQLRRCAQALECHYVKGECKLNAHIVKPRSAGDPQPAPTQLGDGEALELVALPPFVATAIVPVVAPVATVAVIFESEFTVNEADTLLNVTFVACLRPVPVIVTQVPTGPLVGVKVAKVGVTLNCSGAVKVVVPVVTVTFPVSAPAGGEDEGAAGQLSRVAAVPTDLHHRRRTEALA